MEIANEWASSRCDVCKYTAPLATASESNKMLSVLRPLLHLVQATQNRLFNNANNMSHFTMQFIIFFNYTLLRLSKYHYILK